MERSSPETLDTVAYLDRETGEIGYERVFGEHALRFLYETRRGRLVRRLARRSLPNRLYGLAQRGPWSRRKIESFVRSLEIDASEAELPLPTYRSLDDFFTRRLKPGARPIDQDPSHFLFPADGRVLVYPKLDGGRLRVKGCDVGLDELLGDGEAANRLSGGAALVVRLAPADYHRFHFPDAGTASEARPIPGPLDSVHPIALGAGALSLKNKRAVTRLSTQGFGEVALVEVGALVVGTIVQTYRPGPVARGQEKGYFRFGGSTVVVLLEPGRIEIDRDLIDATSRGLETRVKVGTRAGKRPAP